MECTVRWREDFMIYRSLKNAVLSSAKPAGAQTDTRFLRVMDRLNTTFMPKSKIGAVFHKHLYTARRLKVIWILWFYKH
jgi:hypothetical protein